VGTGVLLAVDFKLNNGAASTKQRLVGLNFSVRERTGGTSHDVTGDVTHYRAREESVAGSQVANLLAQPWIPITHAIIMELGEHNPEGKRYGERRVAFQVKTATLTSEVVSDSITLDPVLKEYKVSRQGIGSDASPFTHPLIQYAASQGFQFPKSFLETCAGGTDAGGGGVGAQQDISSGNAIVTFGYSATASCTTRAEYELFFGRGLDEFWRIKSVNVSGATIHSHGLNRFLAKYTFTETLLLSPTCPSGTVFKPVSKVCVGPDALSQITIGDVVVEGPEIDDFVDPANPWKNAFVRPLTLSRPLVQPGIRHPN